MNGNGLVRDLERTSARWPLATAARVDKFMRGKVAAAAGIQSRKVLAAASAELGNRALQRFVELLYDETDGGRLANLGDGGRILIPAPWSRTRHRAYGLSDHGARVLRSIITAKLDAMPPRYRLLTCEGGRWYLNMEFGSLGAGLGWLRSRGKVSPDDWLRANDALPRRGRNGG